MHKQEVDDQESFFLPDLCRVNSVFLVVLGTQLMAFLVALLASPSGYFSWNYLGLVSLFGHWTVLTCAALFCVSRPWMARIGQVWATLFCLLIMQGVTVLYSLIASQVFEMMVVTDLWFVVRNMISAGIIGGIILRYFYLQNQWRIQKQAELRARLEALQSRIRPHFLFNSLNSIASLIAEDAARAEEAILDLSEIFRATLQTEKLKIPLSQELFLCERYLGIEQLRLGPRLRIEWNIDEACKQAEIPPLTLQPLVENAVYHGIQTRPEGGTLAITAELKGKYCYLIIRNPCLGDAEPRPRSEVGTGNRIAIDNIRHRLNALFGDQAVLKNSLHEGNYVVTVRFPVTPGQKE